MWLHVALIKLHTQLNHDDKRPIMIRIGVINMHDKDWCDKHGHDRRWALFVAFFALNGMNGSAIC